MAGSPPSCWALGRKRLVSASWDCGLSPGRVTLLGPDPSPFVQQRSRFQSPRPQGRMSNLPLLPHPRLLPSSVWPSGQPATRDARIHQVHARRAGLSSHEHTAWGWGQEGAKAKTDHSWLAEPGEMPVIPLTPPGTQPCARQGGVDMEQPRFQAALPGPGVPSTAEPWPLVSSAHHPPSLCHQKLSIDPSLK